MHDTALRIGTMVMENYADIRQASILEIGARDINGSLRKSAPRSAEYVGIDTEEGKGVDIVSAPGQDWPVDDDHFDLVIATSVHDTAFWRTFLQMCRKTKPGGHVYFRAPSKGEVHRNPQDYWRFRPDASLALQSFAEREGVPVRLIESFIAEREHDEPNDFCAVFRREPSNDPLPDKFVYQQVRCTNVLTWNSPEVVKDREKTEVRRERENVAHLQRVIENDRQEVERLEGNLRQRHEEISQAWAQVETERAAKEQLEKDLADLGNKLREADEWVFKLSNERREAEQLSAQLQARLEKAQGQLATMLEELRAREIQTAASAEELEEANRELSSLRGKDEDLRWLQQVHEALASSTSGWRDLMPPAWRRRRQLSVLRSLGLFDSDEYLDRYPDVRKAGMDPLSHYIAHGMAEGRQTGGTTT
jgi:SAM-dependent methyltransferase